MAEVILFRPPEDYSNALGTRRCPLGLLYLAAPLLQAGRSVKVIDSQTCRDWQTALTQAMGPETLCVGVSVMTGWPIHGALEFAKAAKAIRPVPVVFGGLHASLLPEQTAAHPLVDVVLVGEGEKRFVELVDRLAKRESPAGMAGVYFKGGEGKVVTPAGDTDFLDADDLPFPAYELIDVEHYATYQRSYMGQSHRCLDLNTDRGCPWRCGFCYNLHFNRRKWRCRSGEHVLSDVQRLVDTYRLDAVNFVADNFFVDRHRVRAVCEGLIARKLNIAWHSDVRIDMFLKFDDDMLRLWRQSGCTTLTLGIESGSDRMLGIIKKDLTVEQVRRAHARAQAFGFNVNYHFMIGFPDETRADVCQTLGLMRELSKAKNTVIYGPSMFVPYPGTPLFDRAVELGLKAPQTLEEWERWDWDGRSKLPTVSPRYGQFLLDARTVAINGCAHASEASRLSQWRRSYFRGRMGLLAGGVSLYNLDSRLFRLAKKVARAA